MQTALRLAILFALASAALSACSSVPDVVTNRDKLPECTTDEVYAPPQQGPSNATDASTQAFDCFVQANDALQPVELAFTLLGTEGERYQAILQTTDAGTINYYREIDDGWEIYENCIQFEIISPGVPTVSQCENTDVS